MKQAQKRIYGISLLGLLIALSVVTILVSYAIPGLHRSVLFNRQIAASNELAMSLRKARFQALKSGRYVTVCPGTPQGGCNDSRLWQFGWMILVSDTPPDGLTFNSPVDLEFFSNHKRQLNISSNRDSFVFRPFGRRATNGTIVICEETGKLPGKVLIISYTGRPRSSSVLTNGANPDCGQL